MILPPATVECSRPLIGRVLSVWALDPVRDVSINIMNRTSAHKMFLCARDGPAKDIVSKPSYRNNYHTILSYSYCHGLTTLFEFFFFICIDRNPIITLYTGTMVALRKRIVLRRWREQRANVSCIYVCICVRVWVATEWRPCTCILVALPPSGMRSHNNPIHWPHPLTLPAELRAPLPSRPIVCRHNYIYIYIYIRTYINSKYRPTSAIRPCPYKCKSNSVSTIVHYTSLRV